MGTSRRVAAIKGIHMKQFEYRGKHKNGENTQGIFWADNIEEVQLRLIHSEIYVLYIGEIKGSYIEKLRNAKKWSSKDIIRFSFQTGLLLEAGLSLRRIMKLQSNSAVNSAVNSAKRNRKTRLTSLVEEISEGMERGEAFHKILNGCGFPPIGCALTEAGEASGNVGKVMLHISSYYEKEKHQQDKFLQLMIYPLFISILMMIFLVGTVWFILPSFQVVFESMGTELPLATKLLFSAGNVLRANGLLIVFIVLLFISGALILWRRPTVRVKLDTVFWKLLAKYPWYGSVQYARIFRVTGMLLQAGIPLTRALETVSPLWTNIYARVQGKGVIDLLREGAGLSEAWHRQCLGNEFIYELLTAGEAAGELDTILVQCADYYDAEVMRSIGKIQQAIEPALMTIMGLCVGGLVIAIMLPLFETMNTLNGM